MVKYIKDDAKYKKYKNELNTSSNYIPPYVRRYNERIVRNKNNMSSIVNNSGPIGYILILFLDKVIEIIYDLVKPTFRLFWEGVDVIQNATFGEFGGLLNIAATKTDGSCYTFRPFRLALTILTPPIGVFLSKGVKGWFSMIITVIICYFNYFIGIIYAIVITMNSKYADKYEMLQYQRTVEMLNK